LYNPYRLLGLLQHLPGGLPKGSTGIGELHASLRTLEEQHAEFVLKLVDLLAKWRLRDMQSCCSEAKVEFFRDHHKVVKMAKFHSNSFYHIYGPSWSSRFVGTLSASSMIR
jgi:hypothetical protein